MSLNNRSSRPLWMRLAASFDAPEAPRGPGAAAASGIATRLLQGQAKEAIGAACVSTTRMARGERQGAAW